MANAEWMLTDEEIIRAYDSRYKVSDGRRAVAQAQAKKMLDKMETELRNFTFATGKEIADSLWWQALRKKALGE